MTVKSETGARAGETSGGVEAERPAGAQPALTDPHALADGDVPTSPGIGPSEAAAAAAAIDEGAKTTPFLRSADAPDEPAAATVSAPKDSAPSSSVSVDVDGGWSIETEKMPAQPAAPAAASTAPAAEPQGSPAAATAGTPTLSGPGTPAALAGTAPAAAAEPVAGAPVALAPAPPPEAPAATPPPSAPAAPAASAAAEAPAPEPPKAADKPVEPAAALPPAAVDKAAEPSRPAPSPPVTPAPSAQPGGPIDVRIFGRTDVGLVREHNEDNFLIADLTGANRSLLPEVREHQVGKRGSLFVVCDGMGGAAAGEVASLLAVDTIYELLQGSEMPRNGVDLARTMVDAIEEAGRRIFAAARLDRTRRGMGTTVTGACVLDGTLYLAQVGDSRAYVVRGTQIEQVTRDQSLVNQLIEAGQLTEEEAEAFEHSNIILQALGTAAEVSVDVTHVPLRRGDILLLCSDGLSGAVTSEQMKEVVLSTPEPIEACKRLTEMANAAGGHDNITVIVAQFDGEGVPPAQPEDRLVFQRVSLPPGPRSSQPPHATPTDVAPTPPIYRETEPDIDGPPPADEGSDAVGSGRGGITLLLLLLALLVGAAVAYVLFSGMLTASAPAGASSIPSAVASPMPMPAAAPAPAPGPGPVAGLPAVPIASRALADVRFRSALPNARLRVDGLDRGAFENGGVTVPLPLGAHDTSVLVDGTVVASRQVTVSQGANDEVVFDGATAVAEDEPAPLAPVAPVPAGVAPPIPDPVRPAGPTHPPRPVVPPSIEPGKSPQRLVPPRPNGVDVPGQQF